MFPPVLYECFLPAFLSDYPNIAELGIEPPGEQVRGEKIAPKRLARGTN